MVGIRVVIWRSGRIDATTITTWWWLGDLATGNKVLVHVSSRQGVDRLIGVSETYFSISSEVDLECFAVILESQRSHREQDVFAIDGLAFLLLALFGSCLVG